MNPSVAVQAATNNQVATFNLYSSWRITLGLRVLSENVNFSNIFKITNAEGADWQQVKYVSLNFLGNSQKLAIYTTQCVRQRQHR